MAELIPRPEAIDRIADHLRDRTDYVIAIPPHSPINWLRTLTAWRCYLDKGADRILAFGPASTAQPGRLPPILAATAMLVRTELSMIVALSKAVTPARTLRSLISPEIPDDGSRDLIILGAESAKRMTVPALLVAAIGKVDPRAAATIIANQVGLLS